MLLDRTNRQQRLQIAAVILFSCVSVIRIISTYKVFNQTWDEPVHVSSGMEWLQQGTYTYDDLHPPLSRIAVALGPYLSGNRLSSGDLHSAVVFGPHLSGDLHSKVLAAGGNAIFAAHEAYIHNLTLARLGVLPFFLLSIWIIWYWTRRLFDGWTSVAAVGLYTALPPVLGHAGLATTDLPVTSTVAVAICAFTSWLERPTTSRTVVLGATAGLAILSKFTALLFLPSCGAAVMLCWLCLGQTSLRERYSDLIPRAKKLALAALICISLVLVCYRFSFHTVTGPDQRPHAFIDRILGHQGKWHDVAYDLAEKAPIPVPEFIRGITEARTRTTVPTPMYLMGNVSTIGWWYFFPVALTVKSPIPFLILILIGTAVVIVRWEKEGHTWQVLAPLASALAMLLVCLPTKFNIGLRHILPIYPFLSIVAGFGLTELWRAARERMLLGILAVSLTGWMLVSTVIAQPDNLAYFNELAGNHPERILVDSDLDWGQDLLRLSTVLRDRHVEHVAIAYNGSADLSMMNLPSFDILTPCTRTSGWVAVSIYKLRIGQPASGCNAYSWLEDYKAVALVGKSIELYSIPSPGKE